MTLKIGINGFGRIGRCVTRAMFENQINDLEIVQINAPSLSDHYAHLFKYDSVHGTFKGSISSKEDSLTIDNKMIRKTSYTDISEINWHDADIIFECTGEFNNKNHLLAHIKSNVKKVLVSAPCKSADSTIVYGVNHAALKNSDQIISIGSCTTNALAPMANILNKAVGIEKGFMTTVHAYTNDQRVLDGSHSDLRRARACNLSMIPTTTGAATAIAEILPELAGKLDGSAIRVPLPNVSLIDLTFIAQKITTVAEINHIMKTAFLNDEYNIIDYLEEKLVSIDINHTKFSTVFDPFETKVTGGNLVRVLSWYDNEWGYANRMIDVATFINKGSLI